MAMADDINDPTNPFAVSTDRPDYQPGDTAVFIGANVDAGGAVSFNVDHSPNVGPDGIAGTADDQLTDELTGTGVVWTVVDGSAEDLDGAANGIVQTSWSVNQDAANQIFLLSGVNLATGAAAS